MDLIAALRERFPPPEWALFTEMINGTGFSKRRTADAVAMNTWPSRGLELWGFEIKRSRQDWKRELEDPAKAEVMASNCDRWYLVVDDEKIVQPGELPPAWGLMAPRGGKLAVKVEATKLEPKEWSKPFIAALLRRAAMESVDQLAINASKAAGYEEGLKAGLEQARRDASYDAKELDHWRQFEKEFEAATGMNLRYGIHDLENRGKSLRAFLDGSPSALVRQAEKAQDIIKRALADTTEAVEALRAIKEAP